MFGVSFYTNANGCIKYALKLHWQYHHTNFRHKISRGLVFKKNQKKEKKNGKGNFKQKREKNH